MLHPLAQKQGKGAAHMQAIIIYGTKAKHNAKYETSTRDMKCIKLFIPTKLQSAAKSRIQIMQLGELRERQKIGAKTDIMFLKNLKTKSSAQSFSASYQIQKIVSAAKSALSFPRTGVSSSCEIVKNPWQIVNESLYSLRKVGSWQSFSRLTADSCKNNIAYTQRLPMTNCCLWAKKANTVSETGMKIKHILNGTQAGQKFSIQVAISWAEGALENRKQTMTSGKTRSKLWQPEQNLGWLTFCWQQAELKALLLFFFFCFSAFSAFIGFIFCCEKKHCLTLSFSPITQEGKIKFLF